MADASKETKQGGEGEDSNQAASEQLATMLDQLLGDVTDKFGAVAAELTAKMDDMSRRIDSLEASIQASAQQKGGSRSSNTSSSGGTDSSRTGDPRSPSSTSSVASP